MSGRRVKKKILDACKWEGGERVEVVLSGVNPRLNKEKALHYQGVPFVITVQVCFFVRFLFVCTWRGGGGGAGVGL